MSETITINFDKPLPVFPLPGCVLLPNALLPLHIFEPRYLQMTREALDTHGLIAMGLFDGEVTQEQYLMGRPPLRPHVCVGYIRQYRPLEDGRYLLLLCGLCRARIVSETPSEPYRKVMLKATDISGLIASEGEEALRAQILEALADPALKALPGVTELEPLLSKPIPPSPLVDLVVTSVCDEPEERYLMLSEADPAKRAAWTLEKLRRMREAMPVPPGMN
jgi:Lon protease-like protein